MILCDLGLTILYWHADVVALCQKSEEVKVTVVTDCDRFGFAECACHLLVSTASGASRTLCKNINIDTIYLVSHPKKHILVNSIADDVVTTRELVQPLHSPPACADLLALNDCTYRRRPHPRGRVMLRSVAFSLCLGTRASADGGLQDA
jgi:hypothetical protein